MTRILWVGVEPTPYVLRLQQGVRDELGVPVDAVFETVDRSQPWALDVDPTTIVGPGLRRRCRFLGQLLRRDRVLVVEGWATPSSLLALVVARGLRRRAFVSTDTWTAHSSSPGRSLLRSLVLRALVRPAAGVLVAGTPHRDHMVAAGVDPARVHVVPMVVDTAGIAAHARDAEVRVRARRELGCDAALAVLYVGRLVPGKGIETTLATLALLPDPTVGLFAGDGPLAPLVAASPRARRLGRRTGAALWDCYAAADVLVLASEHDPWGLVVNEACAAGVPVVVSAGVGAGPDLVGDPERIVAAGAPAALAAAVLRLSSADAASAARREQDRRLAGFVLPRAVQAFALALELRS